MLSVTNLIGGGASSGAASVLSLTFNAGDYFFPQAASGTISNVNIGAASADRIVVIFIAGNFPPTSGTIGGVSATVEATTGGLGTFTHIMWANVTTGTSADVFLQFSQSGTYALQSYSIYGTTAPSPTLYNAINNGDPATLNITTSGAAAVLAGCSTWDSGGGLTGSNSYTWSGSAGVVEDYDSSVPGYINNPLSGASVIAESALSSASVTVDYTVNSGPTVTQAIITWE